MATTPEFTTDESRVYTRIFGDEWTQDYRGKVANIEAQFEAFKEELKKGPIVSPGFAFWGKLRPPKILGESPEAYLLAKPTAFDIVLYQDKPSSSGMSMIHLLAVPKDPILNGVALDSDNVCIIDHLIDFFKTSWEKPDVRRAIMQHEKYAVISRGEVLGMPEMTDIALRHFNEVEDKIDEISVDDFTFGFHLRPDNSVDHLHMHILLAAKEYRKYSTGAHDAKTKDAIEVRDYVLNRAKAGKPAAL